MLFPRPLGCGSPLLPEEQSIGPEKPWLLREFRGMPQSPGVWQSPKRTSIDATTPDVGLDATRAAYPGAGNYATVDEAVENIMAGSVAFGRTGQLVGHGMPGLIAVGCGKGPLTPGAYIGLDNEASWEPALGTMAGHVQALRLTGCFVGSGQDGADLLERVACAIEAPVLAPTGWAQAVAHENISLQDGAAPAAPGPTTLERGHCTPAGLRAVQEQSA